MTQPDAARAERLGAIQRQLAEGLARIDPHHRLLGRPVAFRLVDPRTLEITYRDVPGIAEAEVLGVKQLLGTECYCTVAPQGREHLTVRFVLPLS